jgi:hypothetical protein
MARDPKLTTPFGRAGFCALSRPSTKFKPDGEYSAQVLLPEGPETAAFIADLEARYEGAYGAHLAAAQSELDAKAAKAGKEARHLESIKRADKPYRRPVDPDTDEPLPGWVVTARLGAVVRDGKDGPVLYTRKPVIVDSKNQPVLQPVGSGSLIRMQFTAGAFFTAAVGSGLSLRLVGVQVKELAAMGVGRAEFDETDGFIESKASDPVEHTHAPVDGVAESPVGEIPGEW